ncbi:Exodeoxyribonuclease I subunit C [Ferrimonas marina]|uniref:Exodeoxyribonuclease I n=2 Tax=Ferrimonas marina TaxID=299255 RepID=A0A1M5R6T6_9GAMM|nr:exodeoxyribonuclease I [Ferrimonas marina]SHH22097.1 Exodeoxyribonuclease I subunit C [Ferrimonas marina]
MRQDQTLLWHDYETWGAEPSVDRPAQFAAIRTDLDLNPIEDPVEIFCRLPTDYLPQPEALFVTGITPQKANRVGLVEAEFIRKVHEQMARPGTCTLGYNSIRFDDEVTRYTLYRNFFDPYGREWQNGNSRWDLIDLVRACYALRPEGIEWPERKPGVPSFKLEHLTAANGLDHGNAHDAVSDVKATIALAKLIKEKQPKLYQWAFSLRRKQAVAQQIDILNLKPLLHVSSRFPAAQGCAALVLPMAWHPDNKNAVACVDLTQDPTPLLEWDIETLREKLYLKAEQRPEGEPRVPVKLVHLNRSPFIAPASTLDDGNAERLGLDKARCREHYRKLREQHKLVREKLHGLFLDSAPPQSDDKPAEQKLYEGFFSDSDRAQMELVRDTAPQNLSALEPQFSDPRLAPLFFRYRARNYPETLSEQELQRWHEHCHQALNNPEYLYRLERLFEQHGSDEEKTRLLTALGHYLRSL